MPVNVAPFPVITGPLELWIGEARAARPATDEEPDAEDWQRIGTSGTRSYTEDGVKVSKTQEINYFRGLGSNFPIKATRAAEDVIIDVTVADLSLEQLRIALNHNAIDTTAAGAGVAGVKKIALSAGPTVATFALLARGPSPYGPTGYGQFYIPVAVAAGDTELPFTKSGDPAAWHGEFHAMADLDAEDETEQAGIFEAMTAPATS
jgi:hypothetical protein